MSLFPTTSEQIHSGGEHTIATSEKKKKMKMHLNPQVIYDGSGFRAHVYFIPMNFINRAFIELVFYSVRVPSNRSQAKEPDKTGVLCNFFGNVAPTK